MRGTSGQNWPGRRRCARRTKQDTAADHANLSLCLRVPKASLFSPITEVMDLPWDRAVLAARKAETALEVIASAALGALFTELQARHLTICCVGIVGAPERNLAAIGSPADSGRTPRKACCFARFSKLAPQRNNLRSVAFPERQYREYRDRSTRAALMPLFAPALPNPAIKGPAMASGRESIGHRGVACSICGGCGLTRRSSRASCTRGFRPSGGPPVSLVHKALNRCGEHHDISQAFPYATYLDVKSWRQPGRCSPAG